MRIQPCTVRTYKATNGEEVTVTTCPLAEDLLYRLDHGKCSGILAIDKSTFLEVVTNWLLELHMIDQETLGAHGEHYLEQYDKKMAFAQEVRNYANGVLDRADALERECEREFGLEHADRDPGFPCWKVKGVEMPYCGTRREALQEAVRLCAERSVKGEA